MNLRLRKVVFFGLILFVSCFPHEQENPLKVASGGHLIYGEIKWSHDYQIEGRSNLSSFYADKDSVVNSDDFQISSESDEIVEAIVFNDMFNGKHSDTISFLPVRVDETFPNLIFYGVYRCGVESVTKKNFQNLTKLLALALVGNDIKALGADSFDDLTKLKSLNLFGNKIKILPDEIFQNLSKLKAISLGRNPIAALNDQHFKNNEKLEFFSARQCEIKLLSPTMFDEIKSLRNVDLTENVCIDKEYGGYVRTKYEGYYRGEFINFTEYLSEFKYVVTVNCSHQF